MPFSITIIAPQNGAHLQASQQYRISGVIQGRPQDDPPVLSKVDVSGPGRVGPVQTVASGHGSSTFTADGVTLGVGLFTITVRTTDEDGLRNSASVTVFVGQGYSPTAPAILLDLVPATLIFSSFPSLLPKLQAFLAPLSTLLAKGVEVLVGPNDSQSPIPGGTSVGTERIALWILDPTKSSLVPPPFFLIPPSPPAALFPVLPQAAVAATFVPAITPSPTVPDPMKPLGTFGFGLTISQSTLQSVANALLPSLQAQAAKQGVSLDPISIRCSAPNVVQTVISASFEGIGFNLTITETLGIVPSPRSMAQMVPSVTGTATIDATGARFLEILLVIIIPLGGVLLSALAESKISEASVSVNNALSLANATFNGIPEIIAFRDPFGVGGPFPGVVPNWMTLTASASGITGTGIFVLRSRSTTDAFVAISGPVGLTGPPSEFLGGAEASYVVRWTGIIPDAATFTATVHGRGAVDVNVIPLPADGEQSTSIVLTFVLPTDPPNPGRYHFTIGVSATETSASDPTKTLSATATLGVAVLVRPPRIDQA